MAEQFAFQQGLGQGGAVDGHHGPGPMLGSLVDGPGHLLLARARLALDQDRGRGVCQVADQLEDLVHLRVLAQDVVEAEMRLQLLAQVNDLVLQRAFAHGPFHDQQQMIDIDRLGQEIVGAQPDRLHHLVDAGIPGGDDHRHGQVPLHHLANQVHPVQPGHAQIGDDQAVKAIEERFQSFFAVAGDIDLVVGVGLQELLQIAASDFLIVHDEDFSRHRFGPGNQGTRGFGRGL